MDPMEHLDRLAAECASFTRILETGELDAPVPSCPGWSLAELASHLGGIHRWARGAVAEGRPPSERARPPAGREALAEWFADGAAELGRTLRQAGPDAPAWTLHPPATAGFWMRRQAQETAMHRWDAQASQGVVGEFDPVLAADGVAEVVDMFFPRQVRLGRQEPLAHTLRLEITGAGAVSRGEAIPGGEAYTLAGDGLDRHATRRDCDARVAGPAEALLLLLWKRTTLDDPRLSVTGSRAAAGQVLAANLTP